MGDDEELDEWEMYGSDDLQVDLNQEATDGSVMLQKSEDFSAAESTGSEERTGKGKSKDEKKAKKEKEEKKEKKEKKDKDGSKEKKVKRDDDEELEEWEMYGSDVLQRELNQEATDGS